MISEILDRDAVDGLYDDPDAQKFSRAADFRASSIGSCRRQLCYKMLGHKEPKRDGPRYPLDDGHMHHEDVKLRLSRSFDFIMDEEEIDKKVKHKGQVIHIRGHCDGAIMVDDKPVILDIKSANLANFSKFRSDPTIIPRKYIWQLQAYLNLTGTDAGGLLFKNKNTGQLWDYPILRDRVLWKTILDRLAAIKKATSKGKLLKKEYDLGSKECRYCPFNIKCWKQLAKDIPKFSKDEEQSFEFDKQDEEYKTLNNAFNLYRKAKELKDESDAIKAQAKEVAANILGEKGTELVWSPKKNVRRFIKRIRVERKTPDKTQVNQCVQDGLIDMIPSIQARFTFDEKEFES